MRGERPDFIQQEQVVMQVAFLDRDGTINVDRGYVHCMDDWDFVEGAAAGVALLRNSGFRLAVVTNQSGIAKGLYSEADVDALHAYLRQELATAGAAVDAMAFCPHAEDDGCDCRKPRTGLADQIADQIGKRIDYEQSWMIGDKLSDVGFGLALGTKTALIRSRYWRENELSIEPTLIVASLYDAAKRIVGAGDSP